MCKSDVSNKSRKVRGTNEAHVLNNYCYLMTINREIIYEEKDVNNNYKNS